MNNINVFIAGRYSPSSEYDTINVLCLTYQDRIERAGTMDYNSNYVRKDRPIKIHQFIWSNWHTDKGELNQMSSDYMDDEGIIKL